MSSIAVVTLMIGIPANLASSAMMPDLRVLQDAITPEVYFPAAAVAACIILFGFILVYILRAGSAVRQRTPATSPEKFSKFFNQSDVGIGVIDAKGFFVLSNQSLQDLTGYTATQLSTIGFRSLFADRDDYVEPSKVAGMLDQFGESHQVFLRHRSGDLVRIRFLVLPAPSTIHEDAEVLLIEAASQEGGGADDKPEKSDSLELARATFFASLNHELKTPLTVILGNASLLAEEQRYSPELVDAIITSGKRLLNELDGLLLLSQTGSSVDQSNSCWTDLKSVVLGVVSDYQRQIKSLNLTVDVTAVEDVQANIDHIAFHRLISLLLDFAIHQNRDAGLKVGLSIVDGQFLLSAHRDTSVTEHSEYRSTSDVGRDSGVAVATKLARSLGGFVKFGSPNESSLFDLTLPVDTASDQHASVPVGRAA